MAEGRLKGLDYLRGLMACSVMLYHYLKWTAGSLGAETILGRLGIYAVAIFYILSGLTLFLIYQNKITYTWTSIKSYLIKRIFRIFPLLWLTIILTLILGMQVFDLSSFLLSITGLFGFWAPSKGIGTGVWSIGNELVFYAFFPLIILLWKYAKPVFFYTFLGALFIIGYFFAFHLLDSAVGISPQWHIYINPFNQLFLFAGGFALGLIPKPTKHPKIILLLLIILAAALFILYQAKGDHISLVTGNSRAYFSLSSFVLCFGVCHYPWNLSKLLNKPFAFLGEACYSIYLLHPIIYALINKISPVSSGVFLIVFSITSTLIISYFTFNYLEKPMMQLGRKLS